MNIEAGLPVVAQPDPPAKAAAGSAARVLSGEVIHVADGDSLTFKTSDGRVRIRLDSIDSPEIAHGKEKPGQPFGDPARRALAAWIHGKKLTARCYGQDQYGRMLCDLLAENGESAGRAQVAAGYAWAYTGSRGRYLRDHALVAMQRDAQAARRGLWADKTPVPPWQWRYECWKKSRCNAD